MSELDPVAIRKFINSSIDLKLMDKFFNILSDSQMFEQETMEEDTRSAKREKGNTRILRILKEIR
jgi:hypothetical protein